MQGLVKGASVWSFEKESALRVERQSNFSLFFKRIRSSKLQLISVDNMCLCLCSFLAHEDDSESAGLMCNYSDVYETMTLHKKASESNWRLC
jgi:hypothetical protein